ncbi:MAG TPA: hypothetical protein VER11_35820 [Polyangiaceae bacterium]|jgi:hypothetical protein|nr:hypothetical protein [Polyangiaceae bacterium]
MTRFAMIPDGGTRCVSLGGGRRRTRTRLVGALLASCALFTQGCGKRPTHDECQALLDHYVELLVNSDRPGTNASELHKLQLQAREKAKADPEFAACTERVSRRELDCAMKASNADLLEQCLL